MMPDQVTKQRPLQASPELQGLRLKQWWHNAVGTSCNGDGQCPSLITPVGMPPTPAPPTRPPPRCCPRGAQVFVQVMVGVYVQLLVMAALLAVKRFPFTPLILLPAAAAATFHM